MSTLTPSAPVFSLVAASVTRVAGEVTYQSFPVGVFLSIPEPTVLITVVPTPATVAPSAPSVLVGRGLLPTAVVLWKNPPVVPNVTVVTLDGPDSTISPGAVSLSFLPPKVNVASGQKVTPPPVSVSLSALSPSVSYGEKVVLPSALPLGITAPSPVVSAGLAIAPDSVPLSLLTLEANVAVDVVLSPGPSSLPVTAPDVSIYFGEITLLPEPATASHAVPSPSVLPGEKVLSVGPASLTASVAGPLVTEGQGQLRGYCLLTKTADATCLVNVSLTVHSETEQE
jgi:hypothetical protein